MARKVSQESLIAGAVLAPNFGEWLRERLVERGITPAEFSRRTGRAPQQMSRWFRQADEIPERASMRALTSVLADAPLAAPKRERTKKTEVPDAASE